jgi:hypothetical protein
MEKQENDINEFFDGFIQRLSILQSYYKVNPDVRDNTIIELMGELSVIRKSFLRDWHLVEAQEKILREYEDYFETFGINVNGAKDKIDSNPEIQHHLSEANKHIENIENGE